MSSTAPSSVDGLQRDSPQNLAFPSTPSTAFDSSEAATWTPKSWTPFSKSSVVSPTTFCSLNRVSTTPVTPSSTDGRLRALPRYEPVRSHEGDERTYATPVGRCPSVTTILSGSRDQSGLEAWRESVGPERADFISSYACYRGNNHHLNIENYLNHGTEPEYSFSTTPYWKSSRPFLDTIDRPLLMEGALWHPLSYAGTFDCIAYLEDDGDQPTLLDWKTADSIRKPDKMYEYSLQVSAYVAAANYVYSAQGLNITRAKIVVAIPDESPQIEDLDARALEQYFKHFQARLQRFTHARSKKRGGKS